MSVPACDRGACMREEYEARVLALLKKSIKCLRFGVINVLVQDGLVVQVERTEKFRLFTTREIGEFREGEGI